jgi:polyhydroxyalkanoate synthase subunit PhaC
MSEVKIPVDLILKNIEEDRKKTRDRLKKASAVLTGDLDTAISTTPYEVVYQEDRVKLKHYRPEKVRLKTPLLVIYALINRETMLDLQPRRSVVETFLAEGVEVFMIDWGYPTRKDQFQTIGDHVNGYIGNIVDFICATKGVEQINIMGICMGGVFSIIYTALHPGKVKNLVTTVTPTNFDTDKGLLNVWMKQTGAEVLGDVYANMPGDVMNLGFLLLNPARLMIDKYVGFLQNIDNKSFVENFIRMEKWIFDSPDVPAATFRQFIVDMYKKNLLIQSKLVIDGERVDLEKITVPVLNFYGRFDHLVPPEACDQFTRRIGSTDKEDVCFDTGHIGIYVSSKYQREFAPKIAGWLAARDN